MTLANRARLQVLGAALLFSTGGAAIKATTLTGGQVASLRSAVAAVTILAFLPKARRWGANAGEVLRVLAVGVAYAATLVLFVLANKLTTAANTIFLQSTAPLYILLLGPWLLHERITRRDVGLMLAIGGGMVLFFVGRQEAFATAPDPVTGNILALTSGLTYAAMLLGLRLMGKRGGNTTAAVAAGNLLAVLAALPLALPFGPLTPVDWGVILYLGIFQIGLAYTLLTSAVEHLGALEVSLLLFIEPAFNPIWAWLVHGERPGPWPLIGGAIIMVATLAKAWTDSRVVPAPLEG